MAKAKAASVDFSLVSLDSAAIAAICNLIIKIIEITPEAQHARNIARGERILTWIEEEVFKLPPLDVQ